MKAISLWQPWATLIALGAKQYETRSWGTDYRGPLAIHAAKRRPEDLQAAYPVLEKAGYYQHYPSRDGSLTATGWWQEVSPLPLGSILCIVRLVDVLPTEQLRREAFTRRVNAQEFDFGDYTPGRFAWQLQMVERFVCPFSVRGMQGLWNWYASAEKEPTP